MANNLSQRGYLLLEVAAAAAIIALVSLAVGVAMSSALQIFHSAQAVTRGRLLAASHLEQAAAGIGETNLWDGSLHSTLTTLTGEGYILWQVEVRGPGLLQPLRMVGGP